MGRRGQGVARNPGPRRGHGGTHAGIQDPVSLLWSESSDARARDGLRHVIAALRQALPRSRSPILLFAGQTLALNGAVVDVDVAAFERCLADGTPDALEQAALLYQGDLLSGVGLDEPLFEDWLVAERERLRELALEAFAKLLAHQRQSGARERAIQTAVRLLALDPLQEVVHRTLMRLYGRQGRRGAALKQYQVCIAVLERELGTEPEAETKQLYQELLRRGTLDTSRDPGLARPHAQYDTVQSRPDLPNMDKPLIGREPELARLGEALDEAGRGRGQLVSVVGEAGIGKTSLLGAVAGDAATRGARVLLGRGYESASILPFGPWVDALRSGQILDDRALLDALEPPWRSELARLLPELVRPGLPAPSDDPLRLFESVAHVVERLAALRPLVLMLEDLHWADDMSLRLLAFIARRNRRWRVLLLTTAREEDLADASAARRTLAELGGEPHAASVKLTPLSRAGTALLIRSFARVGSEPEALAHLEEQVWRVSEGNPFVAVETTRALREGSIIADSVTLPLAERVRELIAGRLERLSDQARDVAAVAAVIGREFDFSLLRRASELDDVAAAKAVEELVRRRALQGRGERFDFIHERIHAVVYDQLLPPQRKVLHRRVGEAIEALYAADLESHVLALGVHYLRAEVWDKALGNLWRAAAQATARSAYREAVACLEQALAVLPHQPESRQRLEQGADLHLELRMCLHALGELAQGAEYARKAERLAQELGDTRRLGLASVYLTHYCWLTGALQEGTAFGQRARAIADELGDLPLLVSATFYLGLVHSYLGEYPHSEDLLRRTIRVLEGKTSERCGLVGYPAVMAPAHLARILAECGRFDEAATCGEQAIRIAEALDHPYSSIMAGWALARVHSARGEFPLAITLLEGALQVATRWQLTVWLANVTEELGLAYVCSGRLGEGLDLVRRAINAYEAAGRRDATGHVGEAYLLSGRLDEAAAYAGQMLPQARARGERRLEAVTLWLLGGVALHRDPPDLPASQACYLEALTLAGRLGLRPLVARCHLELGELHRRAGDEARAKAHLAPASDMFREMGMPFWLERARAELTALVPKGAR